MASLLENLVSVLDEENKEYQGLITLANDKTPVIVRGDIDGLGKITEDEQEIVGRLQKLEKQRNKILADIANVVNRDVTTLKLSNLIQMLEKMPDQQKLLVDVQDSLKQTVEKLKTLNIQNQMLIEDKLEMVSFNLDMIRALKTAPQTANYSKDAYTSGDKLGILYPNNGGFDAKQ